MVLHLLGVAAGISAVHRIAHCHVAPAPVRQFEMQTDGYSAHGGGLLNHSILQSTYAEGLRKHAVYRQYDGIMLYTDSMTGSSREEVLNVRDRARPRPSGG